MPDGDQQILIADLHPTVSADRLGTYLVASNFDEVWALALYLWNAQLGEAFHVPIQAAEVALRNRINAALVVQFGDEWWRADPFLKLAKPHQKNDIDTAIGRIANRKSDLCTAQVVASLSFGFWSGMLAPAYNVEIWSKHLGIAFPHLPDGVKRGDLFERARKVNALRNRISHHEPIFRQNLSQEYADILEFLGWICPRKLGWVRPVCRVPAVLRAKPKKARDTSQQTN